MLRIAFAALALIVAAPAAGAEKPKVAVGAVETIGPRDSDAPLLRAVERAIAELDSVALISRKTVTWRLRRARKSRLAACEGEARCLSELGRVVGADWVVAVEIGGLGDVRLLHLELIDARAGRTLRSVTARAEPGGSLEPGALIRLFHPKRYRGALALSIPVEDAVIYIDGRRVRPAGEAGTIPVEVGTHALRVTHPEHRDYVRFVDVAYDQTVELDVDLQPFGIVSGQLERRPGDTDDRGGAAARPWYRRWYVIGGIGVALLAGSAAIWAAQGGELDFDRERELE